MVGARVLCVTACAGALGLGCARPVDLEAERAELLRLHEEQRVAHLNADADLLISAQADDFVDIGDGRIDRPGREANRARFQDYLDSVEFLEWDDISPPVIRISADASMAYVIVHKRVRLIREGDDQEEHTVYAWLETYEKRAGEWRLTTVASTDRPGESAPGPGQSAPGPGQSEPNHGGSVRDAARGG
jgi:ketosteroid isomerase-like protein